MHPGFGPLGATSHSSLRERHFHDSAQLKRVNPPKTCSGMGIPPDPARFGLLDPTDNIELFPSAHAASRLCTRKSSENDTTEHMFLDSDQRDRRYHSYAGELTLRIGHRTRNPAARWTAKMGHIRLQSWHVANWSQPIGSKIGCSRIEDAAGAALVRDSGGSPLATHHSCRILPLP